MPGLAQQEQEQRDSISDRAVLAVWRSWKSQEELPFVKRQRTVWGKEYLHSPKISEHPKMLSQVQPVHSKSSIGETSGRISNPQENTLTPEPTVKLIGRSNDEKKFIDGKPLTALLDNRSQVIHISHDYCQEYGIQIHPIIQFLKLREQG